MIYICDNIERIDRYYRAPTRFFLFDKFSFEKLTRFESKKGKKEREREKYNTSRERNIVAVEKKKKKRIILRHSRPSFLLLLYENDDIKNIIFTPMKLRGDQRKEKRKRRKIGKGNNIKTRKEWMDVQNYVVAIKRHDFSIRSQLLFTRIACSI